MIEVIIKKYIKHVIVVLFMSVSLSSFGAIEVHEFKSIEDEKRYQALIEELRCPKCQNQNLAGSDAPIAVDLKNQTYQMIQEGKSDTEIRQYMFERYGDFISYKPPVRPSTWILWIFPPVLFVLLIVGWVYKTKKKRAFVHDEVAQLSDEEERRLAVILTDTPPNQHNKEQS